MNKDKFDYRKYSDFSRDEIIEKERQTLTQNRFEHCLRVEDTAIKLAEQNHADPELAGLAGLVHDYAKQRPKQEFIDLINQHHLDPDLFNYGNAIWHGFVGYLIVQKELGINDERVLNAVKFHTIASPEMDTIGKIVYMADYIEPGRKFPGVEEAREITGRNLNKGVKYQNKNTMERLVKNGNPVYPKAVSAYNAIVGGLK